MLGARVVAVLALIASGCVSVAQTASPAELELARGAVLRGEAARIPASDDEDGAVAVQVRPEQPVTVTLGATRAELSLAQLFARCPSADYAACGLAPTARVTVGERRHMNKLVPSMIAGGVLAAGAVGLGVCAFDCASPWSYVSGGVVVVAGTALLIDAAVWFVADHPGTVLGWWFRR